MNAASTATLNRLVWICALGAGLFSSNAARGAEVSWPAQEWERATPADVGMRASKLESARDYALTGGGSGYITRHGKLVMAWGDVKKRYDLKSTSKSIGVTALGLAIADGKLSLADKAADRHPAFGVEPPENRQTGWLGQITLQQLATQTAGFEKPGGYERLLFEPGTKWHYSDGGPNWLAECVTLAYRRDVQEVLFERLFGPIGIQTNDLRWRNNAYRPHKIEGIARREFGSGVHANVDAMARLGYLYLRRGKWKEAQLLPASFVDRATQTFPEVVGLPEHAERHGDASKHYGLLWWNNADGSLPDVPRDAYWSWGLYESLIVVIPSLDVVVSRAGKSWQRDEWDGHYDVLAPFFSPIVAAVQTSNEEDSTRASSAPYPMSPEIRRLSWSPASQVLRLAEGSDNWPITWADDGHQYTAYGDGWGFEPKVDKKLSMGFARIEGDPWDAVRGINIRSSGETLGQGPQGKKASGMLMVDGVLYMWVRNSGNSQLAWSSDRGKSWTWSDWKFTTSFGCPTFLNFGQNYAGARDAYVYLFSMDSDSAYQESDRMVLARVPKDAIRDRSRYEFFERLEGHEPRWTSELSDRGAVFEHPGNCYRSGVSYNAALRRYLWCQVHPHSRDSRGPRFEGGFGVYDAPEPWGPWTTVYFAPTWDIGPGETSSFPTKWMSRDGRTLHLVFSGDDHFSVRRATIELHRN